MQVRVKLIYLQDLPGNMEDIRGIIDKIVKGCAECGMVAGEVLAAFVAMTVTAFILLSLRNSSCWQLNKCPLPQ